MHLTDQRITVESAFGTLPVRLNGAALEILFAESGGPDDANSIIAENRSLIEHIAVLKLEAGEVEDDGAISISAAELEA